MDAQGLMRRYGIRPAKSLGQHFLVAPWAYDRLLEASQVGPDDQVLEIGPGLGTLTRLLSERARRVVAVELDRKLLPALRETLAGCANVEIVPGDILSLSPGEMMRAAQYQVVANLPYYITARVLAHLLAAMPRPERLTLMVQRDVAERIVAAPGDLSMLAISVQVFGAPRLVCSVPPDAFVPPPQVWSAILTVAAHDEPLVPEADQARFFTVVRAGFSQKRKQLRNSLCAGLNLPSDAIGAAMQRAEVDPQRRAQTLSIAEWLRLTRALPAGT